MVVASGDARFCPRLVPARLQIMRFTQALDFFRGQPIQQRLKRLAVQAAVRAVQAFESLEQQEQTFEMPAFQLVVLPIDWMSDGVSYRIALDVVSHIVKISRARLKGIMDCA